VDPKVLFDFSGFWFFGVVDGVRVRL